MKINNTIIVPFLFLFQSTFGYSFSTTTASSGNISKAKSRNILHQAKSDYDDVSISQRRTFLQQISVVSAAAMSSSVCSVSPALALPGALDDLPPEAGRSYLQYRIPLQISADFYLWELQDKVSDPDEWGEINAIFQVNNNKGQGIPSRVERDFVNPMRILGLSMPPDVADDLRDAQFAFEKAAFNISKATKGVRRDMPVELDPADLKLAKSAWEDGRVALNQFFDTLNKAVGLNELTQIPPSGPNQNKEYGRSQRRYFELTKKTKLCQNRGGPTLSQAWGGLMVTGYLQDSCGIPDLEDYFYQR